MQKQHGRSTGRATSNYITFCTYPDRLGVLPGKNQLSAPSIYTQSGRPRTLFLNEILEGPLLMILGASQPKAKINLNTRFLIQ